MSPKPMTEPSGNATSAAAPRLLVDVGNSQLKLGLCVPSVAHSSPVSRPAIELLGQLPPARLSEHDLPLTLPAQRVCWQVISVSPPAVRSLQQWVADHRPDDWWLSLDYRDLPLTIAVDYPERVGLDRLAAAVGVNQLRPAGEAAIVIDAGTAITVDAVGPDGVFLGGLILPGPRIAAKSLASHTAQLPDVLFDPDDLPALIGKNTVDAIRGGIYWGLLGAIELLIDRVRTKLAAPTQVFVTGGAVESWSKQLSFPIHYVPDLVLLGIARAVPRAEPMRVAAPTPDESAL